MLSKLLISPLISPNEAILNGELKSYLGYESNSKVQKATDNRHNGYSLKKLQTSMGLTEIPRDRNSDFEFMLIKNQPQSFSYLFLQYRDISAKRYLRFQTQCRTNLKLLIMCLKNSILRLRKQRLRRLRRVCTKCQVYK